MNILEKKPQLTFECETGNSHTFCPSQKYKFQTIRMDIIKFSEK
jgi:hypothetical protein